mgnify:CR=1 FL=1
MKVADLIKQSRIQTNTSTGQVSDAEYLERLNIVQDNIFSKLGTVNKLYAWTFYTSDSVAYQNEYTLARETIDPSGSYPKLKRLLRVFVDYKDGYKKAKVYTEAPFDVLDYKDYNNPIAINMDDSFFIYPAPYQSKADAIRIEGTYIPYPLELTDEDEDIKLAREYHDLYIYGMNKFAFASKQLFDKEWLMEQKYQFRLEQLLREWARDIDSAYMEQIPDLSYFE